MPASAIAYVQDPEALEPAAGALPARGLRQVRQGLSQWLEAVLQGSAAREGVPAATGWLAQLAQVAQSVGVASALRPLLAEALQQGQALLRLGAPVASRSALVRDSMCLLMRLADLEADWAVQQAWLDPLTGLPGRRALQQRLHSELSRLRRDGERCAVALLDLDRFKPVNDKHGHLVGDRYLASFASMLSARLRSHDGAYRFGGDEFVLCLPHATGQQAAAVVDRLRRAMAERPLLQCDGRDLFASFSAGVAELDAARSLGEVLGEADSRLYAAKRASARSMASAA